MSHPRCQAVEESRTGQPSQTPAGLEGALGPLDAKGEAARQGQLLRPKDCGPMGEDSDQMVVPQHMDKEVILSTHCQLTQAGIAATAKHLQQTFYLHHGSLSTTF